MKWLKNIFIKFLNFFGLTLLTKTNVVESKTLHFEMPYPSIRCGFGKSELYIKPVISIDMIFDGYKYEFEFNVWYHDKTVIKRIVPMGNCKKTVYRHYKDFDIPQLLEEFLKANEVEEVVQHINSVVDKYIIDTYAHHYSKLHEVYSRRESMPIGVSPIGFLDMGEGYANIMERIGKKNGEVKLNNPSDSAKEIMDKFGFKEEFSSYSEFGWDKFDEMMKNASKKQSQTKTDEDDGNVSPTCLRD